MMARRRRPRRRRTGTRRIPPSAYRAVQTAGRSCTYPVPSHRCEGCGGPPWPSARAAVQSPGRCYSHRWDSYPTRPVGTGACPGHGSGWCSHSRAWRTAFPPTPRSEPHRPSESCDDRDRYTRPSPRSPPFPVWPRIHAPLPQARTATRPSRPLFSPIYPTPYSSVPRWCRPPSFPWSARALLRPGCTTKVSSPSRCYRNRLRFRPIKQTSAKLPILINTHVLGHCHNS
mmetsp:Transcript_9229/g.25876  ORF Transcript_9229/g.25876 Transcript_9229/m.25876 type:complete len:229 (+) Transcript_9229:787-1473(+)